MNTEQTNKFFLYSEDCLHPQNTDFEPVKDLKLILLLEKLNKSTSGQMLKKCTCFCIHKIMVYS